MSISSIGSATNLTGITFIQLTSAQLAPTGGPEKKDPRDSFRGDFASMLDAIRAGDINAAQTALQTLKTDTAGATYTNGDSSSTTSSVSGIGGDLKSIFDAVSSGDIGAAQSALSTFRNDVRANMQPDLQGAQSQPLTDGSAASTTPASGHKHHHGHHHGGGGQSLQSVISTLFASPTTDGSSTSSSSSSSTDATSSGSSQG